MTNVIDRLKQSEDRVVQLERQSGLQLNRDNARKRKIDTRRNIIIGGLVCKHFPDVMKFQPKSRKADTELEFAELECFISMLAKDIEYISMLSERAKSQCVSAPLKTG